MLFTNPFFLFGLFAIIIPILIHLFNFRRYKTIHFSNVKILQDIVTKTKRESQLKQFIILSLRILAIAALVFAIAQPYIPNANVETKKGKLITIFMDNSFSMDAESRNGNFLMDASNAAKDVVNAFSYNDDFILITQDFSGSQSHILNKDEILNRIDEVAISKKSHSLEEILAFENNVAMRSQKGNKLFYYISDFQKNNCNINLLQNDTVHHFHILQVHAKNLSNVDVDSCWFLSPVMREGYQASLMVRVYNYSEDDVVKLPLRLYINDEQVAISSIDVAAHSYADIPMNYTIHTAGINYGKIEINDAPITFDDRLYFSYNINSATKIIAIQEKEENRYLHALYGTDSLFQYQTMNVNQINYSQFAGSQLVVLDQIKSISSGLGDELKKFVSAGGNLMVFPNEELDADSWKNFLTSLDLRYYQSLVKQDIKAGNINYESRYFQNTMEKNDDILDMPAISQYYQLSASVSSDEDIISLENGESLLSAYPVGKGKVFLSTVALNDNFGSAHKNAIFFIPLHNIGIINQINTVLYNVIGKDDMQVLPQISDNTENLFTIKKKEADFEFVPEQRNLGNETILYFHDQVQDAGFYDVVKGNYQFARLAFNYNRAESDLTYYSEEEIDEMIKNSHGNISQIDMKTKDLKQAVSNDLQGTQLWRIFLFIALISLLAEVLLLRFWGRAKI